VVRFTVRGTVEDRILVGRLYKLNSVVTSQPEM
jgi:hypothetical protein